MTNRAAILFGLVLGAVFSIWNLIASRIAPLADDTPGALLLFYGPMFAAWAVAGLMSSRRTTRIVEGAKTGALVALVTFLVLTAVVIARVNFLLDITSQRPDWQNLMVRYRSSGFSSLRAYVNLRLLHRRALQAASRVEHRGVVRLARRVLKHSGPRTCLIHFTRLSPLCSASSSMDPRQTRRGCSIPETKACCDRLTA